ncbi:MAG: DUF427 domain-containing protein [Acidimicrobiia bacterium]
MLRAVWNGAVVAESDHTVVVDGYHYFPRASVRSEYLQASDHHSRCGWKGTASYYSLAVDGELNRDAAWYYPDPAAAAATIDGYVGFWHGVTISEIDDETASACDPPGVDRPIRA